MKSLLAPVVLTLVTVSIVLFLIGQAAVAALFILLGLIALVVFSMRKTASVRQEDLADNMDPDSRALFVPIRRLTREIEELVEKNKSAFVMATVGTEAAQEAKRIRDQVARALIVRGELKRAMRGRSTAAQEIEKLAGKAKDALSETERQALESAATARQLEMGHYATVEDTIGRIDANVRQAQAALSEIRARLAVRASGEKAERAEQVDDLRDTMGRLKALSITVDEAEQLVQ